MPCVRTVARSSLLERSQLDDLEEVAGEDDVGWRVQFRKMVEAENEYQQYLDDLKILNFNSSLEHHFLGQLEPQWKGWGRELWSWSSNHNWYGVLGYS